jgi:hypothetical protein
LTGREERRTVAGMSRRKLFGLLLVRWGFALLVAASIVFGVVAAVTVRPPGDVPTVALQAAVIYRVEVGAAVFFGLYVATMAFMLALQNRGFTEFGGGGIRASAVAAASEEATSEFDDMDLVFELMEEVRDLRAWRERSEYVR